MSIRKYSASTMRSYLALNRNFLIYAGVPHPEIRDRHVQMFLDYMSSVRSARAATLNLAISAIQFHFSLLRRTRAPFHLRRPTKDKRLPFVLSTGEVSKILAAPKNLKHRTLLAVIYSAGLRVSEAAHKSARNHLRTGKAASENRGQIWAGVACNLGVSVLNLILPLAKRRRTARVWRGTFAKRGFAVDTAVEWCCWGGLNSRPQPYQGCALPLSYSSTPFRKRPVGQARAIGRDPLLCQAAGSIARNNCRCVKKTPCPAARNALPPSCAKTCGGESSRRARQLPKAMPSR